MRESAPEWPVRASAAALFTLQARACSTLNAHRIVSSFTAESGAISCTPVLLSLVTIPQVAHPGRYSLANLEGIWPSMTLCNMHLFAP